MTDKQIEILFFVVQSPTHIQLPVSHICIIRSLCAEDTK